MRVYIYYVLNTYVFLRNILYKSNVKLFPEFPQVHRNWSGCLIVHWASTPKFCISGLEKLLLSHTPTPHPIREEVRQYDNNSSLELPHYVYISIHSKYSLQKFRLVYVNYANERINKIVSNKTKTIGAKNTLKHYALNIAYCLWILYDLGSAIWLRDTI